MASDSERVFKAEITSESRDSRTLTVTKPWLEQTGGPRNSGRSGEKSLFSAVSSSEEGGGGLAGMF